MCRAALADGTGQKDPPTRRAAPQPAADLGFDPQEESLPREAVQAVSQLPPPAARSASAEPQGPPVQRHTGRPQPRVEQPGADSGSVFVPQPVQGLTDTGSSMQLPASQQHHEQQQQSHWGVPEGLQRRPVWAPSNPPSAPQHPSLAEPGQPQQQHRRSRFSARDGDPATHVLSDSVAAQQSRLDAFGQAAHSGFAQLPGENVPPGHLYNGWPQLGPGAVLPGGQFFAAQPPAFWGHEVQLHAAPPWLPHFPQQPPIWPPPSAAAWLWQPHWVQPSLQTPETVSAGVQSTESDHRPLKRPRLSPSAAAGDSNPAQRPTGTNLPTLLSLAVLRGHSFLLHADLGCTLPASCYLIRNSPRFLAGDRLDTFRRAQPARSPPPFAAYGNTAYGVSAAGPTAQEASGRFLQPPGTALALSVPPKAAECATRPAPGLPLQDLQSPRGAHCHHRSISPEFLLLPWLQYSELQLAV